MSEFVVAGLLVTPLVKSLLLALLVFVPARRLLIRFSIHRAFWHPLLAEAAIFVCILAAVDGARLA